MPTKTEIRNRVAARLGLVEVGGTPSTAQETALDEAYDEVYAQLEVLYLTTWASDEDVPDEVAIPLVDLIAYWKVDDFPRSPERSAAIRAKAGPEGKNSITAIRRMVTETPDSEVDPEYY